MVIERALEYLVLKSIIQGCICNTIMFEDYTYCEVDVESIRKRLTEIQKEFIEKYVINSDSKE